VRRVYLATLRFRDLVIPERRLQATPCLSPIRRSLCPSRKTIQCSRWSAFSA